MNGAEQTPPTRYSLGLERFLKITGDDGQRMVENLNEIAPDLGRLMLEFGFCDIYGRDVIDLKTRELVAISALASLGHTAQLKIHVEAALNVGYPGTQIIEVIMQTALYAGFPAALSGVAAAKEVFAKRGV